jgi:HD-GYP domain-containing protein (c-di-GMP phosphodiesterase class II)
MPDLKLDFPVHTLDHHELLPVGTVLTIDVMENLIHTRERTSQELFPLMEHHSVRSDLLRYMKQGTYKRIFSEEGRTVALLKSLDEVKLPPAVLASLDYFKKTDHYTYRHFLIVFALSMLIAEDFSRESGSPIGEIGVSATHDIGKICIPVDILKKRRPLTRFEKRYLEHHTIAGYLLLSYYLNDFQSIDAVVARDHHERRDRSGYPSGIELSNRTVEIVAVSDIYDALISARPYRRTPYSNRAALEEIIGMARDGKFALDIVQALVAHNRSSRPHHSECQLSTEIRSSPPTDNVYGMTDPDDEDG